MKPCNEDCHILSFDHFHSSDSSNKSSPGKHQTVRKISHLQKMLKWMAWNRTYLLILARLQLKKKTV